MITNRRQGTVGDRGRFSVSLIHEETENRPLSPASPVSLPCLFGRRKDCMIQLNTQGKPIYHPPFNDDPLRVEKGFSHFNKRGEKDFVSRILAYELADGVLNLETETFRGRQAEISISFIGETAFRFRMFPPGSTGRRNTVFEFKPCQRVSVREEEDFLFFETERSTIKLRISPWEMVIYLDKEELTRQQIRDHNVDQKYKAIPLGFSTDTDGHPTDCFDTWYMYADEAFYGFGEKFNAFNQRGRSITIWQRDAQSTNSDVSYKGMPCFMSSMGYLVLLNTYSRTHFNMGMSSHVSYTMEAEDSCLDYYVFMNRDYKELLSDYTAFSGRSPMIPRWAFGFWMSRMSYMTRQEVEEIVTQMEKFGMSVDVIHIDAWGDGFRADGSRDLLCFDEERFPDPEGMIRWLRERGIHLSLWMFPYINAAVSNPETGEDSSQYPCLLHMKERGFLVKNPEGEDYAFTPGEGDAGHAVYALDFTNPEFAAYMKERVKRLMRMGVGVIKTDFSEEIPEDAVFHDGTTGRQSHNRYPLLYAKTIYEASREAKEEMGEKALLWGRSGYAGSQNYPANWAGDSSAGLNNLSAILNGGLNLAMSGISFWGFDIGGFYNCDYTGKRVIPDDESYIRSVQMGLMSPLSRSHGQSTPREPWVFSEEAQAAFLKINRLRYRLLPYIYSVAYETHYFGFPMMRPMLLEFQDDYNVRNISTQYMLGDALLVAPVFDQKVHRIYLPAGRWLEIDSMELVEGGRWIIADKQLDRIPLYLRENCALPVFAEAPLHIEDRNFAGYDLILNLKDRLEKRFYDDNFEGTLRAEIRDGEAHVETDLPVREIYIY